jgi:hypothetical protein
VNYLRTIFDCHSPTFAAPSTSQDMLGIPSAFAQDMLCARYSEFQLRLCYARISLENRKGGGSRSVLVRLLGSVIPAWSAGIRPIWMSPDASCTLDAGHPCRQDEALHFHALWASVRS